MAGPRDLYEAAAALWSEYQRLGPGKLRPRCSTPSKMPCGSFKASQCRLSTEVWEAAERVLELSRRCALRPEGLCFVTGEAGLVPRHDLHRAFEDALTELAAMDRSD